MEPSNYDKPYHIVLPAEVALSNLIGSFTSNGKILNQHFGFNHQSQ